MAHALVAALFAVHPLHVESVVWVAERRDVLSGLFFMLTLGAYDEYVRHPQSLGRYLAVVGLLTLGLLAKSMLVTLPPLLLLLDFWPLGRLGRTSPDLDMPRRAAGAVSLARRFGQAAAFGTGHCRGRVSPCAPTSRRTIPLEIARANGNAAVSCVAYLGQLFVPLGLSPFYSFPEAVRPTWQVAAAAALLLAITAAAVIGRRAYPYLFVGWFWYVGMLLPVLELVPVGGHSRADRYTYLPQIGLYIALVWGAMRLTASWPARRWVLGVGSALILAALMACSWRQTGYWQNDKTLWERALACDPKNPTAHRNLGTLLERRDDVAAAAEYQRVLELGQRERNIYNGIRAKAHNGLGDIAARRGDIAGAIAQYKQAIESDSNFAMAYLNLGGVLTNEGKFEEAIVQLRRCIELLPDDNAPVCYIAVALAKQGKTDEAIECYRQALKGHSNLAIVHMRLALLLSERGDLDEAIAHFRQAIEIDPDAALPYTRLPTASQARRNERGREV